MCDGITQLSMGQMTIHMSAPHAPVSNPRGPHQVEGRLRLIVHHPPLGPILLQVVL